MLPNLCLLFLSGWALRSLPASAWLEAYEPIAATLATYSWSSLPSCPVYVATDHMMARTWPRHRGLLVIANDVILEKHHLTSSATCYLIIVDAWVQRRSYFHLRLRLSCRLSAWASLLSRVCITQLLLLFFHDDSKLMRGATPVSHLSGLRVVIFQFLHLLFQVANGHHGHELLVLLNYHHLVIALLALVRLLAILAGFISTFFQVVVSGQRKDINVFMLPTFLLFVMLWGGFDRHLVQWIFLRIWYIWLWYGTLVFILSCANQLSLKTVFIVSFASYRSVRPHQVILVEDDLTYWIWGLGVVARLTNVWPRLHWEGDYIIVFHLGVLYHLSRILEVLWSGCQGHLSLF